MKKNVSILIILLFVTATRSYSQPLLQPAFDAAYRAYPNLPRPLLESMAYSMSRMQNLVPEHDDDYHAGPPRYGIFALVADGKGYFSNNLQRLCSHHGIGIAAFKNNPAGQIMAMAHYLSDAARQQGLTTLARMRPLLEQVCELPAAGMVNQYARSAWLYDIMFFMVNGFESGDIRIAPQAVEYQDWFSAPELRLLQAPFIQVEGDMIRGEAAGAANGPDAVDATDYPPALWVTSPNFSSRGTTAISAVTIHTMQGSYAGSISWFQNTASQVSAHYMVRSSDGQITQMVREASKAWHVGSENPYTIGIEHEGFVNDASWYTTAMYNASAALTKDICTDNGIATTACYNGPSSSGVSVLSSSIKIKGHQHFPNQSHTDPGINWDWPRYYNLLNPVTCTAPATLNESFISTAFANLNWSGIAGAASYTLEWKASAATTWNVVSSTTNYKTIAGLAASSTYNWRIKTHCGNGGVSAYSATKSFTTKATCWDGNEPNNVYTAPSTYNLAGFTYGKICGSGDIDFYRVTTTATQNITFKLQTLPKNYNIETYTGSGTYLAGGYAGGTADETVTLFSRPAGSYLFRVYGATAADNDAVNDYRLQVTLAPPTAALRQDGIAEAAAGIKSGITIAPNPVRDQLQAVWLMEEPGAMRAEITDPFGRRQYVWQQQCSAGRQTLSVPVKGWQPGLYVLTIHTNSGRLVTRFVVQ